MNTEVRKPKSRINYKKTLFALLLLCLISGVSAGIYYCYNIFTYDRIYAGVYINDINAGGMLPSELTQLLNKEFQEKASNTAVKLKCGKSSTIIRFKDLDIEYNTKSIVDKAYHIGREGNLFERAYDIYQTYQDSTHLSLTATFNHNKLDEKIEYLYKKIYVKVKESDLIFQDSKEMVILRSGHHGVSFDKQAARKQIEEHIYSLRSGTITIKAINTPPSKIELDEIYGKILQSPANPKPVVQNNKVTISPPKPGRSIDKDKLSSIIAELSKKEDTERILPVMFTKPALESKDIEDKLFKDNLGSSVTKFYTNSTVEKNRTQNIKLAAAKINNYILGPGQIFSFNNVVGERTVAGGYKDAFIFENGKVVSGLGGGICQVSSTLYYSILQADLEVLERINHMFTVSYIPLGIDAAVAYGSADFRFRNNTNWPIRLECTVTPDNKLVFKLIGTKENPGKSVIITTRTVRTIPYTENKIYDSNLSSGSSVVIQAGSQGYVVDTFKTVKVDGKLVSEKKIHTSTYTPLARQVKVGTKKVSNVPPQKTSAPAPTVKPTPKPTIKPTSSPAVKPTPKPTTQTSPEPVVDTDPQPNNGILLDGQN